MYLFLLLDILLDHVKPKKEKREILRNIEGIVSGKNDQEYQLIWFYRLCMSHAPAFCREILKNNNLPLLRGVDPNYFVNSIEMFPGGKDISLIDREQLKKFSFVSSKTLSGLKGKKINPLSLQPFKF